MTIVIDGTSGITFPDNSQQYNSYYGFKNRIINGAMVIDQRNAGAAITLNNSTLQYVTDRFCATTATSSSSTVTAQRVLTGAATFPYALRLTRNSGTYVNGIAALQVIETLNCQDLAGSPITVSFYLRKGSSATGSFYVQLITGSGTDQGALGANAGTWTNWAGPVIVPTTLVSVASTSFTQYTATATVPAGTNEIAFYFVWIPSGTGSANDYLDITGVQLEKGSTATSFDYRPYGTELALCQRYFQIYVAAGTNDTVSMGNAENTTRGYFLLSLPVSMRTAPACTLTATNFSMRGTTSFVACTSGSMGGTGGLSNSFIAGEFNCGSAHGAPAGGCVKLTANTTASTIQISSEL